MGNLAVADVCAVQPDVITGVHALKIQERFRRIRVCLIVKLRHIGPAGIVKGDIGRVHREGITKICVLVMVIAEILPAARNGNFVKAVQRKSRRVKSVTQIADTRIIAEMPVSIEKLETVRTFPMFRQSLHFFGRGDIIGTVGERVLMKDMRVLIVIGNDHALVSSLFAAAIQP